jgi:hypothetical protein
MKHLPPDDPRPARAIAGDLARAREILDRCARELDQLLDGQYFEIDAIEARIRARYEAKLAAARSADGSKASE